MVTYAVHAQVKTRNGGYEGSKSVPTFYLDSRVQGITDAAHAARIAASVLNPLGTIAAGDLLVSAVPVDPKRENAELDQSAGIPLTWERAHALLSATYAMGDAFARDVLIRAQMHRYAYEALAGRAVHVHWSGEAENTFTVTSE